MVDKLIMAIYAWRVLLQIWLMHKGDIEKARRRLEKNLNVHAVEVAALFRLQVPIIIMDGLICNAPIVEALESSDSQAH